MKHRRKKLWRVWLSNRRPCPIIVVGSGYAGFAALGEVILVSMEVFAGRSCIGRSDPMLAQFASEEGGVQAEGHSMYSVCSVSWYLCSRRLTLTLDPLLFSCYGEGPEPSSDSAKRWYNHVKRLRTQTQQKSKIHIMHMGHCLRVWPSPNSRN